MIGRIPYSEPEEPVTEEKEEKSEEEAPKPERKYRTYSPLKDTLDDGGEDQDPEEYEEIEKEEFIQYFSITSDYQIHLIDFSKTKNKTRLEEVYYIDETRKFVLQKSELD